MLVHIHDLSCMTYETVRDGPKSVGRWFCRRQAVRHTRLRFDNRLCGRELNALTPVPICLAQFQDLRQGWRIRRVVALFFSVGRSQRSIYVLVLICTFGSLEFPPFRGPEECSIASHLDIHAQESELARIIGCGIPGYSPFRPTGSQLYENQREGEESFW